VPANSYPGTALRYEIIVVEIYSLH
jgi:hypothetical protein